jgi:hypothetical protein
MLSSTEAMLKAQAKADAPSPRRQRWLLRLLRLIALAALIGWTLQQSAKTLNTNPHPAGFGRGLLHGVLMPIALPNLLVGNDVPIYAAHNTGVPYKLGYTLGVNGCGALFFGFFYWRLHRLRRGFAASRA